MEYPKIETLFERDPQTFKVTSRLRISEFDLINYWLITEKIDGTNIRIHVRPSGQDVTYHGRTNSAQIQPHILEWLKFYLPPEVTRLPFANDVEAILYGEMYGYKIQSGGNYRLNKTVSFRLFDVFVIDIGSPQSWWLNWENVQDVALKLNVQTVPVLGYLSLSEAISLVGKIESIVAQVESEQKILHEGIVARTNPLLLTRNGRRLMWKLKVKDIAKEGI